MPTPCFWVNCSDEAARSLRRFVFHEDDDDCPTQGYHNATVELPGIFPLTKDEEGYIRHLDPEAYDGDVPWPTQCSCGYVFAVDDEWQLNQRPIYRRADGWGWQMEELPAGAVWEAWWTGDWAGINGTPLVLMIKLPTGQDFMPGMEATNCTRPGEDHDCWCVHGEGANLTIDKNPEPGRSTCAAGAGSIVSHGGQPDEWHGFVTAGQLVP